MIRRFNTTGRRKIAREHARISLHRHELDGAVGDGRSGEPDAEWRFDVSLDLEDYGFDEAAAIRLEAWRGSATERWALGTVGRPEPPEESRRVLREVPETCMFKVVVLAPDGSGRLLGVADKLRPKLPVESLLPLVPAPLGQQVWRLDFGVGDDIVALQINEDEPEIGTAVKNDQRFRSLVMPEILRSILARALIIDRADPQDSEDRWHRWLHLASGLAGSQPPEPDAGVDGSASEDWIGRTDAWIEQAVAGFASETVQALTAFRKDLS